MAVVAKYPECENCEAPCCRRQFMEDADRWFKLSDIRPIYLEAGTDIHVVGWAQQPDGRQPMIACDAYDVDHSKCTIYGSRPDCRTYDCRDDDPDEWQARAHCDLERHRTLATVRAAGRVA